MRNHEFFAKCVESEIPAFGRVLRALPSDRLDYKPHEKNTCAGDLAWQMVQEMESLAQMFDTGVIDYKSGTPAPTVEEMASTFEGAAKTVAERARSTNEERWRGPAKFLYNGHPA